jgi:hypothetical protein
MYSVVTSALDGCDWSAPRRGHFIPGKYPVPILEEAGWVSGLVWTGVEKKLFLTYSGD